MLLLISRNEFQTCFASSSSTIISRKEHPLRSILRKLHIQTRSKWDYFAQPKTEVYSPSSMLPRSHIVDLLYLQVLQKELLIYTSSYMLLIQASTKLPYSYPTRILLACKETPIFVSTLCTHRNYLLNQSCLTQGKINGSFTLATTSNL